MAPLKIPGVDLPMITGPLVLGFMWSYMLYGIFVCQTYLYYLNFRKDAKWTKRLVFVMFVFETLFMVFATIAAWVWFGDGWGDVSNLLTIHWAWVPMTPLNTVPACMVQTFFVWRIWQLGKNIYICIFIELLSLAQLVSSFYFCIKITVSGLTTAALFTQTPAISAWLSCSASCDILITLTIVTLLIHKNRTTSFDKTTDLVTRLIRFTVETGFITSVAAIFELISWLTVKQLSLHYIGYLAFGKLYSNTLLATLNSRALLFGDTSTQVSINPNTSFTNSNPTHNLKSAGSVELTSRPVRSMGSAGATMVRYPGVHVSKTTEVRVSGHPYANMDAEESQKAFYDVE